MSNRDENDRVIGCMFWIGVGMLACAMSTAFGPAWGLGLVGIVFVGLAVIGSISS